MAQQITRNLSEQGGMRVALSHYPAGSAMAAHAHDEHQISLLLAGDIEETSGSRTREMSGPSLGHKAMGRTHANRYGANGALILSINFAADHAIGRDLPGRSWSWQPAGRSEICLAQAAARSGKDADLAAIAIDLLAAQMPGGEPGETRSPPRWARRLREQLREEAGAVDLTRAANEAGIHRGHVSRGFRRSYGVPPSLYGLRCRMARAIHDLASQVPDAAAACAAGFSDQSHLIRVMKRETGFTPRTLRRLLTAG